MTPTEREQQARAFLRDTLGLPVVAWEDIHATMKLLADTERATLERAATKIESLAGALTSEQCDGCGNYDDVAEGSRNDAYRYAAAQLREQAKEIPS